MRDDDAFVDEEMEPDSELNRITNAIIGAAIAVHRELGPGQLESCYEKALAIEFEFRRIPFERQAPVMLTYRGQVVGEGRMDFLVEGRVIIDLKAVESIAPAHRVQMVSYLKMTKLKLGLIINFNVPGTSPKRRHPPNRELTNNFSSLCLRVSVPHLSFDLCPKPPSKFSTP